MQECITNIQRFSLHDGGGIRTVVFFKGCPFRCPWCCNPENLSYEQEEALNERLCIMCSRRPGESCPRTPDECPTMAKKLLGEMKAPDELLEELLRDQVFFDESGGGITLSGGECLAPASRQRFVIELLSLAREKGLHTAIETTLALPIEQLSELATLVSVWLVDFKIADKKTSLEVLGIDPSLRDKNLVELLKNGATVVARMPIIPSYTDSKENVEANIKQICELGIRDVDILPFHQMGEGKYESLGKAYDVQGVPQLSADDVRWIQELCEDAGLQSVIDGR